MNKIARRAGVNIRLLPQLVERAQHTGRLHPDFVHQDVALLLLSIAGVVNAARENAPDAWRRVAALSIEALQAEREQLPPAPSAQQLYRTFALERISGRGTDSRSRSH